MRRLLFHFVECLGHRLTHQRADGKLLFAKRFHYLLFLRLRFAVHRIRQLHAVDGLVLLYRDLLDDLLLLFGRFWCLRDDDL